MNDRTTQRGLTLIESLLGLVMLVLMLGTMYGIITSGSKSWSTTLALSSLQQDVSRTLNRMATLLADSGPQTLFPTPTAPLGSSSLTFQRNEGWAAGAIQWGPALTLELRQDPADPDDGTDNDGDGLVDEGEIVWRRNAGLPDEESVVWVRGVPKLLDGETANGTDDNGNGIVDEAGLSFELSGSTLVVRLSVQRAGPGGIVLTHTDETSVTLRN